MNPAIHNSELQSITAIIRSITPVQAIFLLGHTSSCRKTESIFTSGAITSTHSYHYHLLVLVDNDEKNALNPIQDKLENNLQHFIPCTTIVLHTSLFLQWLNKGQRFASSVKQKALLVYDSGEILWPLEIKELVIDNSVHLSYCRPRINSFLAGAELYKIRQEYRLAAFMLHQALEQLLNTMLLVNTGLRVNTHNIDKLLRYCAMFNCQLHDLFPKKTEKDKHVYSLLNRAYNESRYKDDFKTGAEEIEIIFEKINTIKAIFEDNLLKKAAIQN
jgi:HEPN domain-containing protein